MKIFNKSLKSTKHSDDKCIYFIFKNILNKSSFEQLTIRRKVVISLFFFSSE